MSVRLRQWNWGLVLMLLAFAVTMVVHLPMADGAQAQIRGIVKQRSPRHAKAIAGAITSASQKFDLDPLIVTSVIATESNFRTGVRGSQGEIGLMQLKPSTARWVAKKSGLRWEGRRSLYNPRVNIRLGAAYLALLKEEFDTHPHHYLLAYNMGAGRLRRALRNNNSVRCSYASRVLKRYRTYARI